MKISFYKMQGAGNDFIVIDHQEGIDYALFAKKVCDRHLGVGADGVLILDQSRVADYKMRIINADGTEAEMCGNGARCMAVYICHKFAITPEIFTIETLAGTLQASVINDVAMVQLSDPKDYRPNIDIKLGEQHLQGHFINTGVPHTVIFVQGLQECDVNGLGRMIRYHQVFSPKGTNVNFVEKIKDGIVELRTYERGVEAETLACGTGSVACALISYLQGETKLKSQKEAMMKVMTKSGEMLEVKFDLDIIDEKIVISHVWLKGSGKIICKGEYYDGI